MFCIKPIYLINNLWVITFHGVKGEQNESVDTSSRHEAGKNVEETVGFYFYFFVLFTLLPAFLVAQTNKLH